MEYTAEGDLLVTPPTDAETVVRNARIIYQLMHWADATGKGLITDSSTGFVLPSVARLSPDAALISRNRMMQRPMCPAFVVELLSPSDRRKTADEKMLEWIANGAELGWMIDPKKQSVTIYRPGQEPETRTGIKQLAGEGPVEGFVLDLECIWQP